MRGMGEQQWRRMSRDRARPLQVDVLRRADRPDPVDEDQLKREAEAGRELMKELL